MDINEIVLLCLVHRFQSNSIRANVTFQFLIYVKWWIGVYSHSPPSLR